MECLSYPTVNFLCTLTYCKFHFAFKFISACQTCTCPRMYDLMSILSVARQVIHQLRQDSLLFTLQLRHSFLNSPKLTFVRLGYLCFSCTEQRHVSEYLIKNYKLKSNKPPISVFDRRHKGFKRMSLTNGVEDRQVSSKS